MPTVERARDRGSERGRRMLLTIGAELRTSRRAAGLSLAFVGAAVGISASQLSRLERGLVPTASVALLTRLFAVLGLDLSLKAFPRASPIRDQAHAELLGRLRSQLHRTLGWRLEVPIPIPGDLRAWDAVIDNRRERWSYGVEAETNPVDGQAIARKVTIKVRDSDVTGVILLLPTTMAARRFQREFGDLLADQFPVAGRLALQRLAVGINPGGSAIVTC